MTMQGGGGEIGMGGGSRYLGVSPRAKIRVKVDIRDTALVKE